MIYFRGEKKSIGVKPKVDPNFFIAINTQKIAERYRSTYDKSAMYKIELFLAIMLK